MGLRAGLEVVQKTRNLPLPGFEPEPSNQQPVAIAVPNDSKLHFHIVLPPIAKSPKWYSTLLAFITRMHATCPHIFFRFIILIVFSDEY